MTNLLQDGPLSVYSTLEYRHDLPLTATLGFAWALPPDSPSNESELNRTVVIIETSMLITPRPDALSDSTIDLDLDGEPSDSASPESLLVTTLQLLPPTLSEESADGPVSKKAKCDRPSVICRAGPRSSAGTPIVETNPEPVSTQPSPSGSNVARKDPAAGIQAYLDQRISIAEHCILDEVQATISGLEDCLNLLVSRCISPYPFNYTF